MSFNLTAGNPRAHRIRVYYEGSDTINEGACMCYNWDTTSNWHGGSIATTPGSDAGAVSASTTTAEGSQNEGKYIRVEQPATANFFAFAGVVAKGSWVGKTGPRALDLYVPNGAMVPVRSEANCTGGTTKLYLKNADYDASGTAADNGYIGIAIETIDRSSSNGLVLVKLMDTQAQSSVASIETIASDNTVAIASVETIASDNAVAIASIETIASDNTVAIASVETIASDNAVAIGTHLSDAWAQFSNGVAAQTFNDSSVSSVASDMNHRWSDMVAGISNFNVIMSNAGLW